MNLRLYHSIDFKCEKKHLNSYSNLKDIWIVILTFISAALHVARMLLTTVPLSQITSCRSNHNNDREMQQHTIARSWTSATKSDRNYAKRKRNLQPSAWGLFLSTQYGDLVPFSGNSLNCIPFQQNTGLRAMLCSCTVYRARLIRRYWRNEMPSGWWGRLPTTVLTCIRIPILATCNIIRDQSLFISGGGG